MKTSAKCSSDPAPPDAITGIGTALETAAVSSQSKPVLVPSRSMDVSRISPAPRSAASLRPFDRLALGAGLAAPHVHERPAVHPLRVDRDDRRLAAVSRRQLRDQRRIVQRGGVQADLLGAGIDGGGRVIFRANAAADRQRNENALGDGRDGRGERAAPFDCRRDVENHDLVDAFLVVAFGELGRIAGVSQPFEVDALDDLPVSHVEARDDSFREH